MSFQNVILIGRSMSRLSKKQMRQKRALTRLDRDIAKYQATPGKEDLLAKSLIVRENLLHKPGVAA